MDNFSLPLPYRHGLSKEQAAEYLGFAVTLLSELDIPFIKVGRRCIYGRVDLDRWLDDPKERGRALPSYVEVSL